MRDLATYEVNFATNPRNIRGLTLRKNLTGLLDLVLDARVKIGQNVKFDEDGEAYFTNQSISFENLTATDFGEEVGD